MTTTQQFTADNLMTIDHVGRAEIIDGELVLMAPAGMEHGGHSSVFVEELGPYVRRHRLGRVVTAEASFVLARNPDTVRTPDAAFILQARLDAAGGLPRGFWEGAPDIAYETVSPSDRTSQVLSKVAMWLDHGTQLVIVGHPTRRTITLYRQGSEPVTLQEADTLAFEDIVPGWSMPVGLLFS